MLALPRSMARTQLWANALYGAAFLEFIQYDNVKAQALYEESLSIFTEKEDTPCIANALNGLGFIAEHAQDSETSRKHFETSLKIGSEVPNR
jgi:hypothetical protein